MRALFFFFRLNFQHSRCRRRALWGLFLSWQTAFLRLADHKRKAVCEARLDTKHTVAKLSSCTRLQLGAVITTIYLLLPVFPPCNICRFKSQHPRPSHAFLLPRDFAHTNGSASACDTAAVWWQACTLQLWWRNYVERAETFGVTGRVLPRLTSHSPFGAKYPFKNWWSAVYPISFSALWTQWSTVSSASQPPNNPQQSATGLLIFWHGVCVWVSRPCNPWDLHGNCYRWTYVCLSTQKYPQRFVIFSCSHAFRSLGNFQKMLPAWLEVNSSKSTGNKAWLLAWIFQCLLQ